MSKEIIINLEESEITKLQNLGYLEEGDAADKIAEALHDLIEDTHIRPKEYTFEVTCTEDLVINGDLYWEKGCTYDVSTSDFKEFIAESNYGDGYLNDEDFADYFKVTDASKEVLAAVQEANADPRVKEGFSMYEKEQEKQQRTSKKEFDMER